MADSPIPGTRFNPFLLPDSPLKPIIFNGPTAHDFSFLGQENRLTSPEIEFVGITQRASRLQIYGSPPSAINQNGEQKKKRTTAEFDDNLRAIHTRINELELNSGNSVAGTSSSASSSAARPRVPPASHSHGPRGRPIRGPMLALEASLLEMRNARASGSGGRARAHVHFNDENAGSTRAGRRDQARRGPAGRPLSTAYMLGRGSRYPRSVPLKQESLWKDGTGPPTQYANREHHKCGICHLVKSHPVSYECGHGHCYSCIRMWLEISWKCPECMTTMHRAPFRVFSEEAWIADTYPNWNDTSAVDYNWDGLTFPKKPESFVGDNA
ncbi:hypothetical protein DFH06DRAFT_1338205 [Mycena polygramma]|nr:hypothetical protein DFH06DRAFT_1338205 [Mycena polygramma]